MVTIYIDSRPYEVDPSDNLLAACLSLGFDIPYFCWHPALGSIGACRQCAVKKFKDEKDTVGMIVMSCMEPVVDGLRISINDAEARAFRASVIEWLMVNHPHDCPVCDEGGECHLQDMTVMTGHDYRRCRFPKRTHWNQDLGPFVNHEMNRCIQCYRCVRFYRDYAGGRDLQEFSTRDRLYYGRFGSGPLDSPFSGNLVEVCPTGVFTDKTFKSHYTRKWDLTTAPSVCVHCSLGCNTIPGERYGTLRRIRSRYNGEVNGYFLCDRGRFGYEFVNSERRILRSRESGPGRSPEMPVAGAELVGRLAEIVRAGRTIGIGSPRASLEANFALRALVGEDNFYAGVSDGEHSLTTLALDIMKRGAARIASLQEAARADAVLVLGEDVMSAAPMLGLSLLQSVCQKPMQTAAAARINTWDDCAVREFIQGAKGPLEIATPFSTRLAQAGAEVLLPPDDIAELGFDVAKLIGGVAKESGELHDKDAAPAARIARALAGAARPLIVAGTTGGTEMILRAAAEIVRALNVSERKAALCLTFPECNSVGLALLEGGRLKDAMARVRSGVAETVIILENDLYRRAERSAVDAFLAAPRTVVVLDHLESETTAQADFVLAGATFAESDGTLVNNEGRAQRFFKVMPPSEEVRESWKWLRDISAAAGGKDATGWTSFDQVVQAVAASLPALNGIPGAAPGADFRIHGMKVPRQPLRWSGRTANQAHIDISESKPPDDPDSALAFSMEGSRSDPPPPLISRFWSAGWNSDQAVNKYQTEVGGGLRGGDPGRRIIEPSGDLPPFPADLTPPATPEAPGEGGMWLVPAYHLFGSEELSAAARSAVGLVPEPYIILHPDDALAAGIEDGCLVEVRVGMEKAALSARVKPDIAKGVAAVPAGLPSLAGLAIPGWGVIKAVKP